MSALAELLREGRGRERAQALFYRFLAGDAEMTGNVEAAERLNGLLADEQHHVSRLTARLLEMGEEPGQDTPESPTTSLAHWEAAARAREEEEVRWYERAIETVEDDETLRTLKEILNSERHHLADLGGKWMPAGREGSDADAEPGADAAAETGADTGTDPEAEIAP